MKPLFLTLSLALCWLLAIEPEQNSINKKPGLSTPGGDTTLVKKFVTPGFNVLIQRAEDGDDIYTVVTTTNGDGIKLDQKALIETKWLLDSGCHRHQEHGEYLFKSNRKFTFTLKTTNLWCGLERSEDETDAQYLGRLILIEDPYEIPARERYEVNVEHYDIDDLGKITRGNVFHNVLNDRWLSLSRFDLLPKERLELLRNTIFAKKGYAFKTPELQNYFARTSWYVPKHDNIVKFLSASDKKLITYLEKLENR
jgi:hypothetical protein